MIVVMEPGTSAEIIDDISVRLKDMGYKMCIRDRVKVGSREYRVEEACPQAFEGVDFAFFSAGGDISKKLVPEAVKRGTIVIDLSLIHI